MSWRQWTSKYEVYGNCPELREYFEANQQAYVLRVQKNFRITLPSGTVLSCEQAVKTLLKHKRRWELRSAGKGSKGDRWYAWAWIATASPRHYLLIRKHLRTNELAFHHCFVPEGELLTKARLVRAALAVCAVTAALLRDRTDSQAPEPLHPDQPSPADPGLIPLTIPEIKRLIANTTTPRPPGHRTHWVNWRRQHQARSRWFHKRTRLARNIKNTQVS